MGECENPNGARRLKVRNVAGEPADGRCAGRYVSRNSRNTSGCLGPASNPVERRVNGLEELDTRSRPPALVPNGGVLKFSRRFRLSSEGAVHRLVNRRATRSRTSSHGSPSDSAAMTHLARLSISRPQAASTAAGLVVAGSSSRRASSSAATSARCSSGRASASRRTACARSPREACRPAQTGHARHRSSRAVESVAPRRTSDSGRSSGGRIAREGRGSGPR